MPENHIKNLSRIREFKGQPLSKGDASILLEETLDCLIEVGNGITDEDLHAAADDLLQFRDNWFNNQGEI